MNQVPVSQNIAVGRYRVIVLGLLLALYVASQIVFPRKETVRYSNWINLSLLVWFGMVFISDPEKKFRINAPVIQYFLFTLFCFMSAFWSVDFDFSYEMCITLIKIALNNFLLYHIMRRYRLKDYMMYGFIAGAFVNYLLAFDLLTWFLPTYNNLRFVGTFANSNQLAIAMICTIAVSMLLAHFSRSRILLAFLYTNTALAFYTTLLTGSRKGMIFGPTIAAAFLLTQFANKQRLLYVIFLLAMLFGFVSENDISEEHAENIDNSIERFDQFIGTMEGQDAEGSTVDRAYFISLGWDLFGERPLFGYGIGGFGFFARGYYAHNNYIELMVGVGLIGVLLYYFMYFFVLKNISFPQLSAVRFGSLTLIAVLLLMDIALVSYYMKIILFMIILTSVLLEEEKETEALEKTDTRD